MQEKIRISFINSYKEIYNIKKFLWDKSETFALPAQTVKPCFY